MGLGNRSAKRHETEGARRTAGVNPADYWDFKPGQTVMTVDGFLGKVTAVNDGPLAGTEEYEVTLLNNMGGGIYTASQLQAAMDHSAAHENTASRDYPELAEILVQRPDPGKYPSSTMGLTASLQSTASWRDDSDLDSDHWNERERLLGDVPGMSGHPEEPCNRAYCVENGYPEGEHTNAEHIDPWHLDPYSDQMQDAKHLLDDASKGHEDALSLLDHNHVGPSKYSSLNKEAGFPLCAAGCNHTLGAEDDLVNTDQGMAHRACLQAEAEPEAHVSKIVGEKNPTICENGHLQWGDVCPACRNTDVDQNSMVTNPGDHRPQDVENTRNAARSSEALDPHRATIHTAQWYYNRSQVSGDPIVHPAGHPLKDGRRGLDVGDHVLFDSGHSARIHAVTPTLLMLEGHAAPMHRGPIEGDYSKSIWSSDVTDEAGKDVPQMTEEQRKFLDSNGTGPSKYSALADPYRLIAEASADPDLRFQVTAAWRDVRQKAQRLRAEGRVDVTTVQQGYIIASVQGDHGTYESVIMRMPGTQKVGQWDCGCKWATYHWGAPDDTSRFAGRMCSHALALHYEAQTKGLIGKHATVVASVSSSADDTPLQALGRHLVSVGEDRDEVTLLLSTLGSVNSPFGEPTPNPITPEPGPTKPRNPEDNPASAGPLTMADPESWSQAGQISGLDRMAALDDDALFEAEVPHTAGAAVALIPELLEGAAAAGEAGAAAGAAGEAAGAGAGAGEASSAGKGLVQNYVNKWKTQPVQQMVNHQVIHDTLHGTADPSDSGSGSGSAPAFDQDAADAASAADLAQRRQSSQSTLHEQPEPALPSTDGAVEDGDALDDDSLSPQDTSIQSTGSVEDIVAQFQRTAGAQMLNAGPGAASKDASDIAQAAAAYLQKSAMAEFTPAQQQELINEGEGVKASNLDRLQIEGTHYMALEDALSKHDDIDDEEWLS